MDQVEIVEKTEHQIYLELLDLAWIESAMLVAENRQFILETERELNL